ncbi:hypothetical protein ACFV9G_10515 [Nocardioides sp. NPDC059952]|uniref:hypothetical protein n=1 Tax=Nocardioides sp. NPDC059952 TaxID=3347014 RepID=UPI003668518A
MSPRREQRTATCGHVEAASRLEQARKFLEVAELLEPVDTPAEGNVAGSLAVLAGIAAADAACCAALGRRSRGQDHKAALDLVRQIEPAGREAAKKLDQLLDIKDAAQYGVISLSGSSLKTALRSASYLVEFATGVVRRG